MKQHLICLKQQQHYRPRARMCALRLLMIKARMVTTLENAEMGRQEITRRLQGCGGCAAICFWFLRLKKPAPRRYRPAMHISGMMLNQGGWGRWTRMQGNTGVMHALLLLLLLLLMMMMMMITLITTTPNQQFRCPCVLQQWRPYSTSTNHTHYRLSLHSNCQVMIMRS